MTKNAHTVDIRVSTSKGFKTYHFGCHEITVGRSKEATLRIPLAGMSRKHFCITVVEDDLMIEDLGSANGTSLKGKVLIPEVPHPFHEGDEIKIPGLDVSFTVLLSFEEAEDESATRVMFADATKASNKTITKLKSSELQFKYEEDEELLEKEKAQKKDMLEDDDIQKTEETIADLEFNLEDLKKEQEAKNNKKD